MTVWMVIFALAYGAVAGVAMFRTHLEYRSKLPWPGTFPDTLGLALGRAACVFWPLAVLCIVISLQTDAWAKRRHRHYI